MTRKSLLAASLLVPLFAMSGAAYAGPSNSIPTRTVTQTVETKKPYAEYVPATRVGASAHIYQGGPKSPILHR